MPTPPSNYTMSVLASIPCEPASALLTDLIADHGGAQGGRFSLSRSLDTIKRRYGLIEHRIRGDIEVSIPATEWERASMEADGRWNS